MFVCAHASFVLQLKCVAEQKDLKSVREYCTFVKEFCKSIKGKSIEECLSNRLVNLPKRFVRDL